MRDETPREQLRRQAHERAEEARRRSRVDELEGGPSVGSDPLLARLFQHHLAVAPASPPGDDGGSGGGGPD